MDIKSFLRVLEDIEARRKGLKIWFALVLTWSILRSVVVSRVFHQYGLNPTVYFVIDFLSSIPYAYASAQSLLTFIDKKRIQALWWGVATIASFYAPDIYIVYVSQEVPTSTYIGFGLVLAALSFFAIYQWADSRKGRQGSGH
jgi:hypothetical protein